MIRNNKIKIFILLSVFISISVMGSVSAADTPSANFTNNVTNGSAPLTVQFNDTSIGDPTSWYWDFGDGNNSTEQNPVHNYTTPGKFNVSFTAGNVNGNNTISISNYIMVYNQPTNRITNPGFETGDLTGWTSYNVNTGNLSYSGQYGVHFTRNGYIQQDVDLTGIDNISFWGYGENGSGPFYVYIDGRRVQSLFSVNNTWTEYFIPTSSYTGIHTIKIKSVGTANSDIDDISTNFGNTTANFTATPVYGKSPLTVQFNDTSTSLITNWFWDFGDGATSTEENPTHTYNQSGYYSVTLTTTGPYNNSTKTVGNLITVDLPVASFTSNVTSGNAPLTVQFNDTSLNNPSKWYWDFGDGATSTEQNPVHTYIKLGQFTVTLIAFNEAGNNTIFKTSYISVSNPVSFTSNVTTASNVISGNAPLTVQFNDTTTGDPTAWYWDFGDGATSTEQNPVHTYTTGQFMVTLTATNSAGNNTISQTLIVYNQPLNRLNNSGFETGDLTGWTAGSATSSGTLPHNGQYSVHFGSNYDPSTKFVQQSIDLTSVNSISFWGYGEIPVWDTWTPFNVYVDGTCIGSFVASPNAWTEYIVPLNYTGIHMVKIEWGDPNAYGGADIDDVSTNISGPSANFTATPTNGRAPLTVQFNDTSLGLITNWLWNFGDGVTSTEENPEHVYNAPGSYNVTLTAIGFNCSSTLTIDNLIKIVLPTNTRTGKGYDSIQDAINDAEDGDTIVVGSGPYPETYTENINVTKRVNIIDQGNVIIKALDTNNPVFKILSGGNNSVINGFTITGATGSSGIYIDPSVTAIIINDTITGNSIGINVTGNANISNNTIKDNNNCGVSVTGNATTTNNTITGNGIGINVTGNATVTNNTITGNGIGINVDNGSATIHFNNIYSNTRYGLEFTGAGVNASNNWWGTNKPTHASGTTAPGKIDIYEAQNGSDRTYDPWIVLNATASNNLLKVGDNSTITLDMTHNSKNQDTSSSGNIPDLPVNFNYNLGMLSTTDTTVSKGRASTMLTGGSGNGADNLVITVGNYLTDILITVDNTAPTVNVSLTGGTYNTSQTVTLDTTDPNSNSITYYTTDATDPRTSTTRIHYTKPILITSTTTLRYAAVDPAGNWSPLYLQNYVIGTGGLANSPWPEYQNGNETGQSSYTGPQTNTTKWTYDGTTVYGSAVIGSDGTIYIGGYDGVLYVFNSNGKLKWTWTTHGGIIGSPAISLDGTIYVSNSMNSTLYAISSNGTLKWKYNMGNYNVGSSPVIGADGTIYIPTSNDINGTVYAFNPDGKVKWTRIIGPITGSSVAIGADGTTYIADKNGVLYAINLDGTLKWSKTLSTATWCNSSAAYDTPTIGADGTIYIPICDSYWGGCLYAVSDNGTDGVVKWIYNTGNFRDIGEALYGTPAISPNGIIYVVGASKLYAIDSTNETLTYYVVSRALLWTYNNGGNINVVTAAAIGQDGTIYVGGQNGLFALSPDGSLKWSYNTGSIVSSPAIGSDGTLYIGAINGTFYAFNDVAADFTANTTNVIDPLSVQFTDVSTGNPKLWLWNFGDGTNSTDQNPAHKYSKAGNYMVTLTVTLNNGNVLLRTKTITVKDDLIPPKVIASPNGGAAENVTLNGADNSGSVTVYYTTDSTDPRTSTTRRLYTKPITLNTTTTLLFAAVDPSGNWSPVYNETYTVLEPVTGIVVYVNDSSTYTNGSLSDQIQSILDNAAPGSTIDFLGTEYDNLKLTINKRLNIISNAGTKIVTSDPLAVFLVNGLQAAGTRISGFNIINTGSGSGILLNNTNNVTISNAQVSSTGGSAILVNGSRNVTVNYTSLTNSLTGANISGSDNVNINKSTITGNSKQGVGIYNSTNITVDSSIITNNARDATTNDGAGVYVQGSNQVKITNNQINQNFEGVSTRDVSNLTLYNNTISDNIGDGIYLMGNAENLTITYNTIERDCNGIRLDYTNGENINIRSNIIDEMSYYGDNGKRIPDYDRNFTNSGDGITFGVDYGTGKNVDLNTLNKALTITHNFIYSNSYRDLDGHDSNIDTIQLGSNIYDLTWVGNNPSEALGTVHPFCCKFLTRSSSLGAAGFGTYATAFFIDGDTGKPITDLPSVAVTFTIAGVSQTVMMVNGVATFSTNSLVGQLVASWSSMTASTYFDSEVTGTGSDLGYKAAGDSGTGGSGSTGGNSGNSGSGNGNGNSGNGGSGSSGSATGSGSSGSSSSSSSSASTFSSTTGVTAIAAAAGAAGSSSQGGSNGNKASQSDSKTVQELLVNETKKPQLWGVVGVVLLIILVLGAYYRKDIMDMIQKSKK